MKSFITKLTLATVILLLPQCAHSIKACSCLPLPSPYKAYQESRAVFAGKVISSKDISYPEKWGDRVFTVRERHFIFAVEEAFKGIKTTEVDVNGGRIDSSCYSGFVVGASYLVYAFGESKTDLRSEMCTRTNSLASARSDIHYIRNLMRGIPEPRLYGSVGRTDNDLSESGSRFVTPLEGIKIVVEGKGLRFETVTDKEGLYSIESLPDGKYKARPLLPDKYMLYYPGEVEFILGPVGQVVFPLVQQGRAAYVGFGVGWNNEISGKLLDAEGNLIKRTKVALLAARPTPDLPLVIEEESYNFRPDGGYKFNWLTPGKYLLSATIRAPFKSSSRQTRFYYPGAISLNQASEIVLGESDSLADKDIKLPSGYLVRQIEGVIVWPDGSPVESAWVFLADSKSSEDDDKKYDWVSSDKEGRFSLQAFVGAVYWVHASVNTIRLETRLAKGRKVGGVESLKAQPVEVTVGKVNEPLRIVIPLPEGVEKSLP